MVGSLGFASAAALKDAALIHFSSGIPRGESVGKIRYRSAKWSSMNLENISVFKIQCLPEKTCFDSSCQPPPTRTMTVSERRIRQKQSLGS